MTSIDFIAADELRALRQRVVQERANYLADLFNLMRENVRAMVK